jgi:hypothetical protein
MRLRRPLDEEVTKAVVVLGEPHVVVVGEDDPSLPCAAATAVSKIIVEIQ